MKKNNVVEAKVPAQKKKDSTNRKGIVAKKYQNRNDRTVPEKNNNTFSDQIEGRNAVLELLESGKNINKIFVSRGDKQGSINKIIGKAKDNRIIVVEVDKNKLNEMSQTGNHQGVIAIVPPFEYCDADDILDVAKERKEDSFIIILDGIEDPHNLGAIIRTAETAGVHGIIIPKRRACRGQ